MNKFVALLLLALPVASFGQQKVIYGKAIAGNYWMQDIKLFQNDLKEDLARKGTHAEVTLSLPPSIQGEIGIDFLVYDARLNEHTVGAFVNYTCAGGLVIYADNSESLELEQELKRFSIGAKGGFYLKERLQVYAKVSYGMTSFRRLSRTTTSGSKTDQHSRGSDLAGLAFEPGLQWTKVIERFRFSLTGGYEFSTNITPAPNILPSDRAVEPDWSGFRAGFAAGFLLNTKRIHQQF